MSFLAAKFGDLDLDERLLTARRGTSYFAHQLSRLSDRDLEQPGLLDGWSRKHLVAHVGYNAAALCRLLDWAATGVETPMYGSPAQRAEEISKGATLSPAALRNLFDHTVARLDQKWRQLPESAWGAQVRTAQGRQVPVEETAWMRTREVWIHAVDLDNGARFSDFPSPVLESLLDDVVDAWRRQELARGTILGVEDRAPILVHGGAASGPAVNGSLPAVVRWIVGRGAVDVEVSPPGVSPPRWL